MWPKMYEKRWAIGKEYGDRDENGLACCSVSDVAVWFSFWAALEKGSLLGAEEECPEEDKHPEKPLPSREHSLEQR